MNTSFPRMVAHRGASAYAPENTLYAFKKAHEFGAQWIELDCRLTKDRIPIVIHDATLYRTTRRAGRVRLLTIDEIQRRASKWLVKNPGSADFIPPTLREVLSWAQENVKVYIELKSREPLLAHKVGEMIVDLRMEKNVIIESFLYGQLKRFNSLYPSIPTEFLVTRPSSTGMRKASECGALGLNCNHRLLTLRMVKKIHKAGLLVGAYTINSPVGLYRLMSWGVDTIISDVPDIAMQVASLYKSNPQMKIRGVRVLVNKLNTLERGFFRYKNWQNE